MLKCLTFQPPCGHDRVWVQESGSNIQMLSALNSRVGSGVVFALPEGLPWLQSVGEQLGKYDPAFWPQGPQVLSGDLFPNGFNGIVLEGGAWLTPLHLLPSNQTRPSSFRSYFFHRATEQPIQPHIACCAFQHPDFRAVMLGRRVCTHHWGYSFRSSSWFG